MANTYTQIHIQTVFTVQDRTCIIRKFIIAKKHLLKNMLSFLKDLMCLMMKGIFSNLWNIPVKVEMCL